MSVKLKAYIKSQATLELRVFIILFLVEFHFLSFKNIFSFLLYICTYVCVSICHICVWVPHEGEKKVLGPLELGLQAFVSLLTIVLGRAASALNHEPCIQPAEFLFLLSCLGVGFLFR